MDVTIIKDKKEINIIIDNKIIEPKDNHCILVGNIYNLDELGNFNKDFSPENKILELYKKYKDDLYYKLNGEYALIIIDKGNIKLIRDRLGSKTIYYTKIKDTFMCSTNLKNIINEFKEELEIDKQVLANFLCYSYINEPLTIFKNVYKVSAGSIVKYSEEIKIEQYYDIVKEYKSNKNKIKELETAETILEEELKKSIKMRIKDKEKIGVFLSAGIDSTLITTLLTEVTENKIDTYTIGFYDEKRNEADKAKEIAKYLKTNHHEFYLDENSVKKMVEKITKIYVEPFADPSMLPTVFLYENLKEDVDIILTGDGADQLFCGSSVYDDFCIKRRGEKFLNNIKRIFRYRIKKIYWTNNAFISKRYVTNMFCDIIPKSYYNIKLSNIKGQIKYMLFDIKTFLSNRLFTKLSMPGLFYNINTAHPFVDNHFIKATLQTEHKFKYYKKQKKYILKRILYKKIPCKLLNKSKNGFGIPLDKWLYTIFFDDIIMYSDKNKLIKQGLFNPNKIEAEIKKLKKRELNPEERYVMFGYYMFQRWYQEHIEDLWTKKEIFDKSGI